MDGREIRKKHWFLLLGIFAGFFAGAIVGNCLSQMLNVFEKGPNYLAMGFGILGIGVGIFVGNKYDDRSLNNVPDKIEKHKEMLRQAYGDDLTKLKRGHGYAVADGIIGFMVGAAIGTIIMFAFFSDKVKTISFETFLPYIVGVIGIIIGARMGHKQDIKEYEADYEYLRDLKAHIDSYSQEDYYAWKNEKNKTESNKEPVNTATVAKENSLPTELINDETYVRDIKTANSGAWFQYDVLLNARGYGWEMMLDWADYLADADIMNISQAEIGILGGTGVDVLNDIKNNGNKCVGCKNLENERGFLSIAGISKILKAPLKVVWVNQTQVLRFFTIFDDVELIKRYTESAVRRNFGTADEMKLGTPVKKKLEMYE